MKSIINNKMPQLVATILVLALCVATFPVPVWAQPFYRPGGWNYGFPHHCPPHRYPYYRGPSDFDKALAVIGTVGTVAAIARARNNPYYYRPYHAPYNPPSIIMRTPPPVIVPSPVVVQKPVIVEKQVIVEKPVVIERHVPTVARISSYSSKLGASFRIENVQIPGYKFTAARLTSDPIEGSPLKRVGLRTGDVITRLDDDPVDTLAELDRHDGNTLLRYVKTGTTKVLLANIHIPPESGALSGYYAPDYHVP